MPHSGQSHQLSTGTVKKPTLPVGFFASEVSRFAPGRKKSTWIGALDGVADGLVLFKLSGVCL
ncbi:hypothetical protein GDA03_16100 [Salmonella enterica subsp. enterica]|nr:hypothetical protein [Salmonella enterica subsp. enterica]